jgi:hypothetical protein
MMRYYLEIEKDTVRIAVLFIVQNFLDIPRSYSCLYEYNRLTAKYIAAFFYQQLRLADFQVYYPN